MTRMTDSVPTMNPIIDEAQERLERGLQRESTARNRWLEDLKFAEADSDNGYQWPNDIRRSRDVDEKPCLTLNETRQHNLQIINDAMQNRYSVTIRATGEGASKDSAEVLKAIIRKIEYQSNAQDVYNLGVGFQVKAGIGYWRVMTRYEDPRSFNQEIYLDPVPDPLKVILDCDIKEFDASDMNWAIVFEDIPKKDFDKRWPKFKDIGGQAALGQQSPWFNQDYVRVAEYWRRRREKIDLVSLVKPISKQRITLKKSDIPSDLLADILEDPHTQERESEDIIVEWFLIVGEEIADKGEWAGKYIPIVRLVGEETMIDGILDRKGHTRCMKDAQRQYNYWSSSATEHVALQSKTPYIGPMRAFENLEVYWNTANRINHAWLPYNDVDDDGGTIAPPQRQPAPSSASAYLDGMKTARAELMMVSGQHQAEMGAPSNERSGSAITARQRQGDNATYHFIDHFASAIRFTGKILIDLIPKIYDTERLLLALNEDGTDMPVTIDPKAKATLQVQKDENQKAVMNIFNPNMGKYEVQADIGPSYGTKREESFNALKEIITQAPQMTSIIGDLLLQSSDFYLSSQAAERLKRMVPPQALGTGPSQQEQALTQHIQQLTAELAKVSQELNMEKVKSQSKDQLRDIEAFNAETKRLQVFKPDMDAAELHALVSQATMTALNSILNISGQDAPQLPIQPPAQGASNVQAS